MDAAALAAWVQAVFSVVAIVAGFGTVVYQNRHNDKDNGDSARITVTVQHYIAIQRAAFATVSQGELNALSP